MDVHPFLLREEVSCLPWNAMIAHNDPPYHVRLERHSGLWLPMRVVPFSYPRLCS